VKQLARNYYHNMEAGTIPDEEVKVERLFSLSHDVYRASMESGEDILIKIYRNNIPEFTDLKLESRLMSELAVIRCYPEVLYQGEHYRVERFIHSYEVSCASIEKDEAVLLRIVRILAQFSCEYKELVLKYNMEAGIVEKYHINELRGVMARVQEQKRQECP
jgi:hypothetical protein